MLTNKQIKTPRIKLGTIVMSRYASKWTGYVIEELPCSSDSPNNHRVYCMITHDKNGIPVRKPFKSMALSTYWLQIIAI